MWKCALTFALMWRPFNSRFDSFFLQLILFLFSICRCICLAKIDFDRSSPSIYPNFSKFTSLNIALSLSLPPPPSLLMLLIHLFGTYLACERIDFSHLICYVQFHFDDCFTQIVDNAWGDYVSLT